LYLQTKLIKHPLKHFQHAPVLITSGSVSIEGKHEAACPQFWFEIVQGKKAGQTSSAVKTLAMSYVLHWVWRKKATVVSTMASQTIIIPKWEGDTKPSFFCPLSLLT
jgi:hypothetical protein